MASRGGGAAKLTRHGLSGTADRWQGRRAAQIRDRWHAALQAALAVPAAREALAKVGAEVAQTTPAQFERQIAQEISLWRQFVAERGISAT
jgi:tripartite-type tricarboxylate transporter receptor subunit TctC